MGQQVGGGADIAGVGDEGKGSAHRPPFRTNDATRSTVAVTAPHSGKRPLQHAFRHPETARWRPARGRGIAPAMTEPRPSAAGGFLIAIGILVGAGVGLVYGQATPGVLIGFAFGAVAALVVWARNRAR
jgi:hypothetical protein